VGELLATDLTVVRALLGRLPAQHGAGRHVGGRGSLAPQRVSQTLDGGWASATLTSGARRHLSGRQLHGLVLQRLVCVVAERVVLRLVQPVQLALQTGGLEAREQGRGVDVA